MPERTIKRMKRYQLIALYEETVENINQINAYTEKIEKILSKAENSNDAISGTDGFVQKIKSMVIDAENKLKEVNKAHTLICVDDDQSDSIKTKLEDLVESFKETKKMADDFQEKFYGYEEEDKTGDTIEVPGLLEKVEDFLKSQESKFSQLSEKIETELLPGATTVGLAKSYVDQSDKYKSSGWVALFIVAIFAMLGIAIWALIAFSGEGDVTDRAMGLLSKFMFYIPLVWLALFASKKESQNRRLQEEYIHKATMAKSFEGYHAQIENLGETEKSQIIKEQLMEELVSMVGYNPSSTLDNKGHKDSPPGISTIEKVAESTGKVAGGIAAEIIKKTK